jgi:hypothetical protein
MRTKLASLACLALAAGAVAAGSADAKPFGFKTAKFRIEVSGVQTTAWKVDQPTSNGTCEVGYKGNGTEVVRFASKKPLVATATSYSASDPSFRVGKQFNAILSMPGKVTRHSDFSMWGTDCTDGDGKGGKTPDPPDCGQKKTTVDGEVKFENGRLMVDDPPSDLFVPLPLFRNCHVEGTAFPDLLWRTGGNAIGKPLSGRKLFSRKSRTITVGRRDVYQDAHAWHETTLKYTVSLTRVGKVKVF